MLVRGSISYRAVGDDDIPFLCALYATTREEEMKNIDWPDEQKKMFLEQQFRAQKDHYDAYYSDADFLIIEKEGETIGRLYIDRGTEEWSIIDIALMPQWRGLGIGTALLREILDDAAALRKPVTLYVEVFNPARHLYDRLGFVETGTNGVYRSMIWRP